jgi:hypothetical protein
MHIKHLSKAFVIAAIVVAAGTLSSCAWLNGSSIAHTWAGTLIDLFEPASYEVTLDLSQDGGLVSGSATFAFAESTYDVVVDGTREEDGSFVVTLYDVSEANVTLTGTLSDFGSTYSGTWDLDTYENHGTFTMTATD